MCSCLSVCVTSLSYSNSLNNTRPGRRPLSEQTNRSVNKQTCLCLLGLTRAEKTARFALRLGQLTDRARIPTGLESNESLSEVLPPILALQTEVYATLIELESEFTKIASLHVKNSAKASIAVNNVKYLNNCTVFYELNRQDIEGHYMKVYLFSVQILVFIVRYNAIA